MQHHRNDDDEKEWSRELGMDELNFLYSLGKSTRTDFFLARN